MTSLIDKAARYLGRSGPLHRLRNRSRFRGLIVDDDVSLDVSGEFQYGMGCSIGTGSNITVPQGAALALGDGCYVGRHVELGPTGTVRIGTDTSIQDRCILLGEISIGRYCRFAPNIYASSGRHYFDLQPTWLIQDQDQHVARDPALAARHHRPVVVEDDCWLGINSVLLPGITLGKGAVIGAGSIVSRDVEPYTVVAGCPARLIRKRLEFTPPCRLNWANSAAWPYFYAGFEISQAAMRTNAAHGGLVARGEFRLSLDTRGAGSLHLVAKSAATAGVVRVHGQQRAVTERFDELVFELADGAGPIRGECAPPLAAIVISEAWVE